MDDIKGIARVKFRPGKVEEWKRLTEQVMEIARTKVTRTLSAQACSHYFLFSASIT